MEKEKVMDDLISRQAALDAVTNHSKAVLESYPYDLITADIYAAAHRHIIDVLAALEGVPSAQPEIIRCKDCIDYQTDWIPETDPDRHYCATMDSFMPEDGFCNYAERRTDGQTD